MDLKVLEHYTSIQGEGPRVGTLTQFVRFAGCNMRCPGWPCDTQHAIEPSLYIGKYNKQHALLLYQSIENEYFNNGAKNVCFTGGEPFMQDEEQLRFVVQKLFNTYYNIEFFTNGSFFIPDWAISSCNIMMDWKLEGSGEHLTEIDERTNNAMRLKILDGIKFVCKDRADLESALSVASDLRTKGVRAQFWIGTAWDCLTESDIVEFMKEHRLMEWKINIQVHKYIWPADMVGV